MSWPTPGAQKLIDAMERAEGGPAAFIRAVQISMPTVGNSAQARVVAANTIAHALWDFFINAGTEDAFVRFLGGRWAPIGAGNDPGNLNQNWVPNVLAALRQSRGTTA